MTGQSKSPPNMRSRASLTSIHQTGVYSDNGTVVTMNTTDSKREIFYRHADVIQRTTYGDPAETDEEKKI